MSPVRRWIWNDFVFAGVTLALVALTYTPLSNPLNEPLCAASYSGAEWMLTTLGVPYTPDAAHRVISGSSFAMEITGLCSGLRALALFSAVVLMIKLPRWQKALHVAMGLPILMAINILRLTHLFTLGEARSPRFALYHEWIWPTGIVCVILLYRLAMLLAPKNREKEPPQAASPSLEVAHG